MQTLLGGHILVPVGGQRNGSLTGPGAVPVPWFGGVSVMRVQTLALNL